jgi:hypothetical protein
MTVKGDGLVTVSALTSSGTTTVGNIIQTSGNANTFAAFINHMGASQSVAGLNTTKINAQTNLSVGYAGEADASAVIEARSTTKGFLPPRMTNAQRIAIATPAVGLMVYCTDVVEGLYINKSTGWTFII